MHGCNVFGRDGGSHHETETNNSNDKVDSRCSCSRGIGSLFHVFIGRCTWVEPTKAESTEGTTKVVHDGKIKKRRPTRKKFKLWRRAKVLLSQLTGGSSSSTSDNEDGTDDIAILDGRNEAYILLRQLLHCLIKVSARKANKQRETKLPLWERLASATVREAQRLSRSSA